MKIVITSLAISALVMLSGSSFAEKYVRWTYAEQPSTDLQTVVIELNQRTGWNFTIADFKPSDDRELAFSHYQRFLQIRQGAPIDRASLRIWTVGAEGKTLQVEANVENPADQGSNAVMKDAQNDKAATRVKNTINSFIKGRPAGEVLSIKQVRVWHSTRLVEKISMRGIHGIDELIIDSVSGQLISQKFTPHPSVDRKSFGSDIGGLSIQSRAYPVYEEFKGQKLETEPVELRYLKNTIRLPESDLYAQLRDQHLFYKKLDPQRASTPEGRAAGYWSLSWLANEFSRLEESISPSANSFEANGMQLEGQFATISIHPDALGAFGPFSFQPKLSNHVVLDWQESQSVDDFELILKPAYFGRPWLSMEKLQNPSIVRDPQQNSRLYIENGFDEIQVYYSITKMFESLRPMGFRDPELSERPFHAFLFNPNIDWKNNAFYDNDTINFTTYSADEINMARDNTTIWHELGHGLMDRLMGPDLILADTGGLSEGMADFVAQLVIEAATNGISFPGANDMRIINNTDFFLTNEVHDDGEAYGGVMKEILDRAIENWGREGLIKVTDLILEAMRLSRDNPHLTADDWFEHVRFADQIGRDGVREAGELRSIIDATLISRNFGKEDARAQFSLSYDDHEVIAGSPGSRDHEIPVSIASNESAAYRLTFSFSDGSVTKFKYPVTVKVLFNSGALQGAIHWVGEESGAKSFTFDEPTKDFSVPLEISGTCDSINRADGSCSDYAYVQLFENGGNKPIGKKRFYLKLKTKI